MTKRERLREAKRQWRIDRAVASGMKREEAEQIVDALYKSTNKFMVIVGNGRLRRSARG